MTHGSDLAKRLARLSPERQAALERKLRPKQAEAAPFQPQQGPEVALSSPQRRQWFLNQIEGGGPAYNVWSAWRLRGPLDVPALREGLLLLARRHETLRTTFVERDGGPVQVVATTSNAELEVQDFESTPEVDRESQLYEAASEFAHRGFDIREAPPFRLGLFRLEAQHHVLVLAMDHIISDAWSRRIFLKEVAEAYTAVRGGDRPEWDPLSAQYRDFTAWQLSERQTESSLAQLEYWKRVLAGAPPALILPTDHSRPAALSSSGAEVCCHLSGDLVAELEQLAHDAGATLFMVLLAGFATVLGRYADEEDLVVGTPVAGRSRPEFEGLIGFCVNTIVLRTSLEGSPTFRELVERVRDVTLEALRNQELPFERLVESLKPERSLSRSPLFQVMLALHNVPREVSFPGVRTDRFDIRSRAVPFDLYLTFERQEHGLSGTLRYSTDLFTAQRMNRLLLHLSNLFGDALRRPEVSVGELRMGDEAERRLVTVEWNRTATPYPRDATVHGLFDEMAARQPERPALLQADEEWSYGHLRTWSDRLAYELRSFGVVPGSAVGVVAERDALTVLSLIGVLKAGGAYVPLDAEYPDDRLGYMMRDAGVRIVVASTTQRPRFESLGADVVVPGSNTPDSSGELDIGAVPSRASDLAYVIYTSGSTGRPKGVGVSHRSIVQLVRNMSYAQLGPEERVLQIAPLSFDASTFEVWAGLLNGGTCVVSPERISSGAELAELIQKKGITTAFLTTALFNALVDEDPRSFSGLSQLLTGGEVCSPEHVRRAYEALPEIRISNVYGPTESTTFATSYEVPRGHPVGVPVPIGRPIANTTAYMLNGAHEPVAIGEAGELYLGGDGVARGYVGDPELTAERFISDPIAGGDNRLYATGDVCRWQEGGLIEYVGRRDRQVKIRGHRIELGEVEWALKSHPDVAAAVVVDLEEGADRRLAGYVVPASQPAPRVVDLQRNIQASLPRYMVPAVFVFLEALPTTPSGKVDVQALPPPPVLLTPGRASARRPRDSLEVQLVAIWSEVLGRGQVGIDDDFFDLGGHSLMALRLFSDIEKQTGRRLPLATLFEAPTITELADRLRDDGWEAPWSSLVPIQPNGDTTPFFCVHGLQGNVVNHVDLARRLGPEQPYFGLQASSLGGGKPLRRVEAMAAHYLREVRAIAPTGPYIIGGFCMGTLVALEMAQRLLASREEVTALVMFDPPRPFAKLPIRRGPISYLRRKLRPRPGEQELLAAMETHLQDPMRRAHLLARSRYRPRPYPGFTLHFEPSQVGPGRARDPVRRPAWARLLSDVEHHLIEGHHNNLLREPMISEIVEVIIGHLTPPRSG